MNFTVGEIVQLKSGGPKMTVVSVHAGGNDSIQTTWFAGAKKEGGYFPPEALERPSQKDAPQ
ncbi:DUF2158 domain-containing protein [Mesorhizobium sp. M0870]|uniref:YodC family protein n=1 Tax=Mesorhizobium sp. M0870 TaxID=2957016 RepID=UPI00333B1669